MLTYLSFPTPDKAAIELSQRVCVCLQDVLTTSLTGKLVVSGGKSPLAFFSYLQKESLDWAKIQIGLVDERIVPTDNPDSNALCIRQNLLGDAAASARFYGLMPDNPQHAASPQDRLAYATEQQSILDAPDVLILGMGNDGHFASIFPVTGTPALSSPQKIMELPAYNAPYMRLTWTMLSILSAKNIFLFIPGKDKQVIYQKALHGDDYPIRHLIQNCQTSNNLIVCTTE